MRVLLLDTSKEFRGGQNQLCLLADGLLKSGADLLLCVRSRSPLAARLREMKIPFVCLDPSFEGSPVHAVRLASLMKERNTDLVNAQGSHDHTLAWAASALMKKPPVRVVTRRVDFVPGASAFHRWKYFRGADHYIAISDAIRNVLLDFGVESARVRLIRSAVPGVEKVKKAREEIIQELRLPADAVLIGNVAGLVDHKGHRYLIEAMPKILNDVPKAKLLIAGDGELRSDLESLSAKLCLSESVHFLGWRKDVPKILSALDLFVMTSHMEGLCTSILDAMSVHVPVVATNAGGIPEIVRRGETGRLAENKNPASIAEKILHAIRNPDESRRMADKALEMVHEEFSVARMVRQTTELYEELVKIVS